MVLVLRRWFDFCSACACAYARVLYGRVHHPSSDARCMCKYEDRTLIRYGHQGRSRGPPILHPTPTTPLGQSNNRVHTLLLLLGGKHSSPVNFLACLVHVHVCMGVLSTRKHHETIFLHFSLSLWREGIMSFRRRERSLEGMGENSWWW